MDRNPRLKKPLKSSADCCHIPRSAREEWLLHFHAQISSFPESLPFKPLKGKEEFRPELPLSFSGASHPPEPVDTILMRPIYGPLKENLSSEDPSYPLTSSSSSFPIHPCAEDTSTMVKHHAASYPLTSSLSSSFPIHPCVEDTSTMIKDHGTSYHRTSSLSSSFPMHPCAEDISIMIHHDKSTAPSSSTSSPLPAHGGEDCIWDSSPTVSPLKSEERNSEKKGIDSWESEKTSMSSSFSDDSSWSDMTVFGGSKPHKGNDVRWKAILAVRSRDGVVGMGHFRLLKRLGCGDIGSVYLSELSGTRCCFAMKVMDRASLESRKKMMRAQTEREILQMMDHPFLPTLYSHFETDRFSCLVMEYCPGGDLHMLRQRQPGKRFSEFAARFYAAEVLLALEYLHMLGVIYRDLKPENVLVRDDGHIMLSDFDLSLRCAVSPTLMKTSTLRSNPKKDHVDKDPSFLRPTTCMEPACFMQRRKKTEKRREKQKPGPSVELVAEPTAAKSMSFVGTHEYLAPEIIKGEGHGAAVDWWTFGIFLHELLYGKTPFKGGSNRATLFNVVGQQLKFHESPTTSNSVKDLIRGLLVKEPKQRMGMKRGAAEIKQHSFFEGVNWALIRCSTPPEIPPPPAEMEKKRVAGAEDGKPGGKFFDFEFF